MGERQGDEFESDGGQNARGDALALIFDVAMTDGGQESEERVV